MPARIDTSDYSTVVWCTECAWFSVGAWDYVDAAEKAAAHNTDQGHKAMVPKQKRSDCEVEWCTKRRRKDDGMCTNHHFSRLKAEAAGRTYVPWRKKSKSE